MIRLSDLLQGIGLPAEVEQAVLALEQCGFLKETGSYAPNALWQLLSSTEDVSRLQQNNKERWERISPDGENLTDEKGYLLLACMLQAGRETLERYRSLGIGDGIFYDTFQCFPRFIREHYESFGSYGFDRGWWTWRQINMKLFKLGELEFEMIQREKEGTTDNAINVHIPSGSHLSAANCKSSYEQARNFFQAFYPAYGEVDYVCSSWLLAPALKRLLPPESNILTFQQDYDILETFPDENDFMMWVFKTETEEYQKLPEDTSLQRRIKEYLQEGGKIGCAYGRLR
jgi:hypothetical protein